MWNQSQNPRRAWAVPTIALFAGLMVLDHPVARAAGSESTDSAFGDLGGSLLEGGVADLLRDSAPPAGSGSEEQGAAGDSDSTVPDSLPPVEPGLLDRLLRVDPQGEDLGQQPTNPLESVWTKMQRAEHLIGERDTTGAATQTQQLVLDELDALIEKAEKNCKDCKGGGQCNKPSQQSSQRSQSKPSAGAAKAGGAQAASKPGAPNRSTARLGETDATATSSAGPSQAAKDVWGKLPQRVREQMLQASPDEFLPEYREAIEAYYRRLSADPNASGAP